MTLSSNYGAAPTYVKIASTTLTATTSTITFSNIPQGYTDLRVVIAGNQYTSASYGEYNMRYNSDSGSNYSNYGMYSNTTQGTTPIANYSIANQTSISLGVMVDFTAGSNTWVSHSKVDIMSYSNTAAYKSCLVANSMIQSGDYSRLTETVGTWRSTAAITSISFHAITDPPFNVGVTVNIYGIKAALTPKASGGDIIVQDGTYWYHAFTNSGAFTPKTSLTNVDYLVIAGGGGGSGNYVPNGYGGAGAGGLRSTVTTTGGGGSLESQISLSSNVTYAITVGAGGVGTSHPGASGSNSSISGSGLTTITSLGGGPRNTAGGSGGGGSYDPGTYGAGTTGQGYRGGNGYIVGGGDTMGGGGGGAGAVGGNATSTAGGAGGAGVLLTAFSVPTRTGASGYYAGGGAGAAEAQGRTAGAGGAGGGGAGGVWYSSGMNAVVNTGSGGGSAGAGYGGKGGSGLVIVRYPI